jgi:FtsP/CotA-like multicopper oxidase with cupredoxin domain
VLCSLFSDWYHNTSRVNLDWYLSADSQGNEPVPENGLINGLNVFNCSRALNTTASCKNGSRASFLFKPWKRYRLRLINSSAFADFDFSIDNHTLTVVEADGVPMKPVTVTRLPIAVAQRYSVIVRADQKESNYWMRAVMNQQCFTYVNEALDRDVRAIIHYADAPNAEPTTPDTNLADPATCNDLDQSMLRPRVKLDAPNYDVNYYVEVLLSDPNQPTMAYMNGTSWRVLTGTTTLLESNANENLSSYGPNQFVVTPPKGANIIQVILRSKSLGHQDGR